MAPSLSLALSFSTSSFSLSLLRRVYGGGDPEGRPLSIMSQGLVILKIIMMV